MEHKLQRHARSNRVSFKSNVTIGLPVRHVFHNFDPGRDIIEGTRRIGINADVSRGKIRLKLLVRNIAGQFDEWPFKFNCFARSRKSSSESPLPIMTQ